MAPGPFTPAPFGFAKTVLRKCGLPVDETEMTAGASRQSGGLALSPQACSDCGEV